VRLFTNSVRKLSTRLATWLTFGLLAGLLVLIMLAVGATAGRRGPGSGGGDAAEALLLITFPGAYDLILGFMLGLGGLFAVIYAAAVAGSEWNWGTLKTSVARGESRSRYLLATFAGIAVVMVVGLLVTFAIGVGAAILAATIAGVPLDGIGDAATLGRLPEQFARGAIAIISQGALGFAVATLARSQLAGIGIGIAIYFGGTFARIFLPDIVKYLPFQLGTAAVGGSGGFGGGGGGAAASISPDFAVLLLIVWLIGSLVVAVGFAERAEITG
jgi:ABC-type transport system involved in multi-copper enzyme maturation permease subunit